MPDSPTTAENTENQPNQPMAEVFGYRIDDFSPEAVRHRQHEFCPFHNKVAKCTKVSQKNPLGVCSIFDDAHHVVVTCPVRFRQDYLILTDAADFFFPKAEGVKWTDLREIRLDDADGQSAGNIDIVLVSYDEKTGRILDFGALEVQAVYISGNIRQPFDFYMKAPDEHKDLVWRGREGYPRPDYLSSSRKRLAPQLIYKGGILHAWGKKQAVVVDSGFFGTLPAMERVSAGEAELAWLIYDLQADTAQNRYKLTHTNTVYTRFSSALERITRAQPGTLNTFVSRLQKKLDAKRETGEIPPDAPTLVDALTANTSGGDIVDESEFAHSDEDGEADDGE